MAILEVGISVNNRGEGRVQEGDIVVARKPLGYIGKKEKADLLWLLLETSLTPEELMSPGSSTKRKYHIPLANLGDQGLDLNRVRNTSDAYQPIVDVRNGNGVFVSPRSALSATGRVVDKEGK